MPTRAVAQTVASALRAVIRPPERGRARMWGARIGEYLTSAGIQLQEVLHWIQT